MENENTNPITKFFAGLTRPHPSVTDLRRRDLVSIQLGISLALALVTLPLVLFQGAVTDTGVSPEALAFGLALVIAYFVSRTSRPILGTYLLVGGPTTTLLLSIPNSPAPSLTLLILVVPLLLGTLFLPFWQNVMYTAFTVTIGTVTLFQFATFLANVPEGRFATSLLILFGAISVGIGATYNQVLRTVSVQANNLDRVARDLASANEALEAERDALDQRVTERTRALETAYAVSREISRASTTEELFRTVAELLKESFGYYHVHAYLLDAEQGRLLMRGGTGEAGATLLARGHSLAVGQGLVGSAADTGVAVLVPDVTDNPNWLPNPLLPDTKSEVAVPIREGDRVVGVIDVQQDRAYALGQEDTELLQSIAVQVGVVLRNLQNLEQSEQPARREALTVEIARRIQATTSVDEALQVTARELGRALNGAPTHVLLAPEREN